MTGTGDLIADEALSWAGTPVKPMGRRKGVGCDCKGLIAGVAAELGRPEAASVEALARDYRRPDARRLIAGMKRLFDAVSGPAARGDVALIRLDGRPLHLGIVLAVDAEGMPRRIVHACPHRGEVADTPARRDRTAYHSFWRWRDVV
jgi:cell wall-associated NlpC family hydrolase